MRKRITVLALLVGMSGAVAALTVKVTVGPQRLADNVVHYLVNNDLHGFKKMLGTAVHQRLIKQNRYYTEKGRKMILHSLKKDRTTALESFKTIRQKLIDAGVDIKKTRMFFYGFSNPGILFTRAADPVTISKGNRPLQVGDIRVIVTDGKRLFGITLDDCVKIGWDWIIGDRLKWGGELKLKSPPQ